MQKNPVRPTKRTQWVFVFLLFGSRAHGGQRPVPTGAPGGWLVMIEAYDG